MPSATQPNRPPSATPNGGPTVRDHRVDRSLDRPGPDGSNGRLLEAVREGATRATIAVGLGGLAVIHAVDSVGKWTETRYMFWMFIAASVAALGVAAWTVFTRSRMALLAAAVLAGSVLLGYVVNRTVGMPNATGDIGNWVEPLGLASTVIEAATVVVAAGAYALSGRRGKG